MKRVLLLLMLLPSLCFGANEGQLQLINNNTRRAAGSITTASQVSSLNTVFAPAVLTGALTANTLKTMLSVSGSGVLTLLAYYTGNTTSRTLRLKLTVDGVVVSDFTTGSITTANLGALAVGLSYTASTGNVIYIPENVYFNHSLLVEVASSLTETDLSTVKYRYQTFQ